MSKLTPTELCLYFEGLPQGRKDLLWVRCERALGAPMDALDPTDPVIDEVFDRVLTDMWCGDQLERLVALGRLERGVAVDGSTTYRTS